MWRVLYLNEFEIYAFEFEGRSYFDTEEEAREAAVACRREHDNAHIEYRRHRADVD